MLKTLTFIRHNAIALLALFVSLGGTSWAAFRLRPGSVGTRLLRNHSITPAKFARKSIGGYVRLYAEIGTDGSVIAAHPSVRVTQWNPGPNGIIGGHLEWPVSVSSKCIALATAHSSVAPVVTASVFGPASTRTATDVTLSLSADASTSVAVVCPQP